MNRIVLICILLAGCADLSQSVVRNLWSDDKVCERTFMNPDPSFKKAIDSERLNRKLDCAWVPTKMSSYELCRFSGAAGLDRADRQLAMEEMQSRKVDCAAEQRKMDVAMEAFAGALQATGKSMQEAYRPPTTCIGTSTTYGNTSSGIMTCR